MSQFQTSENKLEPGITLSQIRGFSAYCLRKDVLEIELLKYKALFFPTQKRSTGDHLS